MSLETCAQILFYENLCGGGEREGGRGGGDGGGEGSGVEQEEIEPVNKANMVVSFSNTIPMTIYTLRAV